ncbi:MAG: protoporphyrinogen oxidase [Puniceicoccales bacterium]|jgi:oxygen-dependent protoporphyrinogen oxidase|nr:protoporphyrinogen oxidase [Puniceicoccales bacterium]
MHITEHSAIVLGAGPAGLSAAAGLLKAGAEPLVLERAARAGGSLLTERAGGFLCEGGPNSLMLEKDGAEPFLRQFGVEPVEALPAAKKRFLVCGGRPVAAPSGPLGAITTPLLSWRGKLRFLGEPFAAKAPPPAVDETVGAFVRRRLGAEAAARLVEPMVAGIYAGDIEKLSLRSAFPRLREMEQRYGSLVRAGLAKGRAAPVRRLVNFAGGMREIPDALVRFLGGTGTAGDTAAGGAGARVRLGVRLREITREGGADGGLWRVTWSEDAGAGDTAAGGGGDDGSAAPVRTAVAPALVIATPPWTWEKTPLPVPLADALRPWSAVAAPPLAVVSLGYEREKVAHPLDGFGMLSPAVEGRKILGTLFQSSLFAGRAPDGHVLLTSFVGGCRSPELASLAEPELTALVAGELRSLLGAAGAPVFARVTRWARAIPQYDTGYDALLSALDAAERAFPVLRFTGNFRAGVALPKTIWHAAQTAASLAEQLAARRR